MLKKLLRRPDGVTVVGRLSVWDKVSHRSLGESVWSEIHADLRQCLQLPQARISLGSCGH